LERVVKFRPEMIFFQAGVDPLASDSLGRLSLTLDGLKSRDSMVIELAQRSKLPLVITIGGGYSSPIELTVQAHAQTFRTAADRLVTH
ncbi:MAG: histone deacetylase, partial [Candidatus Udaeobacter sp.]